MYSPQRIILDKPAIIKQLGLFSDLTPNQVNLIAVASEFYEYKKDSIIYNEGDPSDAFYYLISGRIMVFTKDRSGRPTTLEYLHRGAYFGILSLLTGEPHSVSTQIVNDAVVLKILKEDFHRILKEIPTLAIHFSSTLSRRLKRKDLGQKTVFESTIISIYGTQENIGATSYALNLTKTLGTETKKDVIFVDMASPEEEGAAKFLDVKKGDLIPLELMSVFFDEVRVKNSILKHESGINILRVPCGPNIEFNTIQIIPLLSYLTNIFDYCVIDLTHKIDAIALTVLSQSDLIHIVTDNQAESINSTNSLVKELEGVLRQPQEKIKIIVNELNGRLELHNLLKYRVYATLADINRNEREYNSAVRRIAREVGGVLVGLALGSGAGWGLSHIGVIKVLEKEGIPVDVVVGSSIGALIGALWAVGNNGAEIERIAIQNKKKVGIFTFKDLTFPIRGLISDVRTLYFLRKYLGGKTFQDVKFPLKIVAASLKDRKEVVIDSGSLAEAVRASISIPGIYSPVRYRGGYLIDGGILDPVPVSVLFRMNVRKIIAVNVLPGPEDIDKCLIAENERLLKEKAEQEKKSSFQNFLFNLKVKIINFFTPNIMDTIVDSIQAMEYSMAEANCRQADIAIHPRITDLLWWDFLHPEKFIPLGEEACLRALPKIKKLLEE